jgi:hypothetical protein
LIKKNVAFIFHKKKEHGLKYIKASQELFRKYFAIYKSLEKVLWKRQSWGGVAQGGEGLIWVAWVRKD